MPVCQVLAGVMMDAHSEIALAIVMGCVGPKNFWNRGYSSGVTALPLITDHGGMRDTLFLHR
jgi:hypothetical protein